MIKMHIRLGIIFLLATGDNYCALHYDGIKQFLKNYKRPITVLELGSYGPEISLNITRDFNATCVLLADDPRREIYNSFEGSDAENVILLKKKATLAELIRLGECEHFDVVLLLNGFDNALKAHDRLDWQKALAATTELADHCIMVLRYGPEHEDPIVQIKEFLKGSVSRLSDDGSTVVALHSKPKKYIFRTQWGKTKKFRKAMHLVASTFAKKVLIKKQINTNTPWQRGINLSTFKGLSGSYPSLADVIKTVKAYENLRHNDLCIGNMVIQGKTIIPIDFNDPRRSANAKKAFERLMRDLRA